VPVKNHTSRVTTSGSANCHMDFIGPYNDSKGKPLSENGFRYVLTVIDYFSNYVEAFPLKRKLASEVAEKMYELFCRHGVPM
jgi:hypothetical protein